MQVSVLGAQFNITFDVKENLSQMLEILSQAQENDIVVFPEGSISGYDTDILFLDKIDILEVNRSLEILRNEAKKKRIHLWVGSCLFENDKWYNAALGFTPDGKINRYNKVNLANHERGVFSFGSDLHPFPLDFNKGIVNVGVQICRDLKYPEQWRWLAMNDAQIILHLNNAKGNSINQLIWRSQLISRASENQRFVISVNTAAPSQDCPTIVISPQGEIIYEIISSDTEYFRVQIDLNLISNWYIDQSRTDIITINRTNA